MTDQATPSKRTVRKTWNYTPALPIKPAPYWDWPPRPLVSLFSLLRSWNPAGSRFLFLVAAIITWFFFTPDISRARTLEFDWIAEVWLRNFIILTVVAGGLHLLLLKFCVQGDEYRYDLRPMVKGARAFWFKNQVWDNMFWSFIALQFWTFWECLIWYAYANGWATMITFDSNPIWFLTLIVLVPFWASFHFYWLHRLLHVGPLYTKVHARHHRNLNTGPWSGLAMHPVESFFLMFDTMIFFLVPAHPIHVLFLLFHHGIGAPTSHVGFEKVKIGKFASIEMGDFFHQLHHRFFDCNYGSLEMPWDVWFKTFHDGSPAGDELMRERRRRVWPTAKEKTT